MKFYNSKETQSILKQSTGIDYTLFEYQGIGFDYEALMNHSNYTLEDVREIQHRAQVGQTPLMELTNLSRYARRFASSGYGARIFIKDEAQNLSGSFKARRAAMSIHEAKRLGYKGVVAATSGNYGAAVAALAARQGLNCIIIQESFDSKGVRQPEIEEKTRACEAYGADVLEVSVGPELFTVLLNVLDTTGYFNASLYSPYGVMGIETLGHEIVEQLHQQEDKTPSAVIITHAGGGNLTGTARGIQKAGVKDCKIIGASVDLTGLHMASDLDFNRKSFTTGHTGFGIPFAVNPDRSDVPRSAARPLRYMDEYHLVNQGSVFFITEALALLEGLERGPAGNTALAAAFVLARQYKEDEIIVVQETEYTGAGKHYHAQCSFAQKQGIELLLSDEEIEIPGKNIVFPRSGKSLKTTEVPLDKLRKSYLKSFAGKNLTAEDIEFLSLELKQNPKAIQLLIQEVNNETA